jgi:hypothetical protein
MIVRTSQAHRSRICIVTAGSIHSSPRVVRECSALLNAGYAVEVGCRDEAGQPELLSGTDVMRRYRQAWPVPRRSPRIARLETGVRSRIAAKAARSSLPSATALCVNGGRLQSIIEAVDADLYVGHGVAGLVIAAAAARRRDVAFAFDAEDFHSGEMADDAWPPGRREMFRAVEEHLIPKAAYVTAASPLIAQAYSQRLVVPAVVVLNTPLTCGDPRRTFAAPPEPADRTLFWVSQTIGPDRGLESAIRAIAQSTSRPFLFLMGRISLDYQKILTGLANSLGIGNHLVFLPLASPCAADTAALGFALGLASEPGFCPNNNMALSNKVFTFLGCARPVLASDTPAHVRLQGDLGDALRLFRRDDEDDLARVMDEVFLDADVFRTASASARQSMEAISWHHEKVRLLECVSGALTIKPGGASRADGAEGEFAGVPHRSPFPETE